MKTSSRETAPKHSPRRLLPGLLVSDVLDSIEEGVYLTDTNRQIIFWNKAAERITGWLADEVIGRACYDDILIHEDQDGRAICGEEHCPLHRAIITDSPSLTAVLVYAKAKNGTRVPVEVSVSPVHDERGTVVGGVEVFRDVRKPKKS